MTNEFDTKNIMTIRISKNAIQFTTPEGQTYFKNFSNFRESMLKGQKCFVAYKTSPPKKKNEMAEVPVKEGQLV